MDIFYHRYVAEKIRPFVFKERTNSFYLFSIQEIVWKQLMTWCTWFFPMNRLFFFLTGVGQYGAHLFPPRWASHNSLLNRWEKEIKWPIASTENNLKHPNGPIFDENDSTMYDRSFSFFFLGIRSIFICTHHIVFWQLCAMYRWVIDVSILCYQSTFFLFVWLVLRPNFNRVARLNRRRVSYW